MKIYEDSCLFVILIPYPIFPTIVKSPMGFSEEETKKLSGSDFVTCIFLETAIHVSMFWQFVFGHLHFKV